MRVRFRRIDEYGLASIFIRTRNYERTTMKHLLPELPYAEHALAPHLSTESFQFHHGKHHAAYVSKLNELLHGHEWADLPLVDLIIAAHNAPDAQAIFNNAAQHWNHCQFWSGMKPNGGGAVPDELETMLVRAFGSVGEFKRRFTAEGVAQFGSGWVWLVVDEPGLEIIRTANADNPLTLRKRALIGCDVWEHAYYIDYRNRRANFLDVYLNRLVNWEEAAARLHRDAVTA
jgi:Fe-Mn family superoxide dismutase